MRRSWRVGVVALCLGLCLAPGVFAQSQATTGVIEGTVVDESGGVLPGVAVTLRNTDTNFEKVVTTGPDGRFRGLLLPLGPYRVTASLSGFAKLVREALSLAVGQSVKLTLTLKVSAVTQEVKVTAANPVIETARTEGSTQIDQAAVANLPNNGRNFLDFAKLTPSVSIVQGPDGTRRRSTARRASPTIFPWTAPTSTTRSSASSAAVSARRSHSTWTRSRRSWS